MKTLEVILLTIVVIAGCGSKGEEERFVEAEKKSSATSAQDHEAFIQGKWRLVSEFPKDKSGRSRVWILEWTFSSDGTFLQSGYPPITQKGKYRIVKQDENKLTLELYEQKGTFGNKDKQIEIVVDRENEKLKIMTDEGFSRVENEK